MEKERPYLENNRTYRCNLLVLRSFIFVSNQDFLLIILSTDEEVSFGTNSTLYRKL